MNIFSPSIFNKFRVNFVKIITRLKFNIIALSINESSYKNIFFCIDPCSPDGYALTRFIFDDILCISTRSKIDLRKITPALLYKSLFFIPSYRISTETLYVGSTNSSYICQLFNFSQLVEIQHGCLDSSYFSGLTPSSFYARSISSQIIYSKLRPLVNTVLISNCFDILLGPNDKKINDFSCVYFYSSNPSALMSHSELAYFEDSIYKIFSNKIPFSFILHPRDSILKFRTRHLGRSYPVIKARSDFSPSLVLASYSSALFDKVNVGDGVLNILFKRPDSIADVIFSELPSCDMSKISLNMTFHSKLR